MLEKVKQMLSLFGLVCRMKVLLEICIVEVVGESWFLCLCMIFFFFFFLNGNVNKLFKLFVCLFLMEIAYETLSDENKRREYDQFGRHGGQGNNESPFHQSFNFNFDELFKDFDLFSQNSRSKKHFENHFRSHREAHNRQRRSFQEFSFGGGLFDDVFENMEKMFSFSDFENAHRHAVRTDARFHGSSKHCRTVTQRRGNMVTTYTDCSGQ